MFGARKNILVIQYIMYSHVVKQSYSYRSLNKNDSDLCVRAMFVTSPTYPLQMRIVEMEESQQSNSSDSVVS